MSNESYEALLARQLSKLEDINKTKLKEQAPLIDEFKKRGIKIEQIYSIWKLIDDKEFYFAEIIPVLEKYLNKESFDSLNGSKEELIECFRIKGLNKEIIQHLLMHFRQETKSNLQYRIGDVLNDVVNDKEFIQPIEKILLDESYGTARTHLIHLYGKLYKVDAVPVLKTLLKDRSVVAETLVVLGKLKAVEALEEVETYTRDEDSWIRGKAKTAYKKIQKAAGVNPTKLKASKFADAVKASLNHEASMGFDIEEAGSFLRGLSRKFKFKLQVKAMEDFVYSIDVEQTNAVFVDIDDNGRKTAIHFEVFMDDENTPELYFFFDNAELAEKTQDYMEEWAEKHNY